MGDKNSWKDRILPLVDSLMSLPIHVNHENCISVCLSKRSELIDFIKEKKMARKEKSDDLARQFLRDGDHKFQLKHFKESLDLYSKSIAYASKNNNDLPLTYLRRSIVLLYLDTHQESQNDIEMFMESTFRREKGRRIMKHVLQLLSLEKLQEAMWALYEILRRFGVLLPVHYTERIYDVHQRIIRLQTKYNPTLKNGENPDFPSASNCLQLLINENERHVVAKCDINVGDVLFVEKAFAFTVTHSHCTDCGIHISAPIPCLHCVDISFCSMKCRDNAWESYHKFECGFINLMEETGVAHLALRIILKAASTLKALKRLHKKFIKNKLFTEKENNLNGPKKNNFVTYSNEIYENVYNLKTHVDSMDVRNLLDHSLTATLLALYLATQTTYTSPSEENIKELGQILLLHITQANCNIYKMINFDFENLDLCPKGGFLHKSYGGAMYPSASMMNHSCEPSVTPLFHKDTIIIRARKEIKKGEDVFSCYCSAAASANRQTRQEWLKKTYGFDCNCTACSQKYDPYDVMNSLQCERCKGPLVLDSNNNAGLCNGKSGYICLNCGGHQTLGPEQMLILNDTKILNADGNQKLKEKGDVEGALWDFVASWKLGRTIFYKLCIDLFASAVHTASCLYGLGDLKSCISFLKCIALCAERREGSFTLEHGTWVKTLIYCILTYCTTLEKSESKDNVHIIKSYSELGLHYCDVVTNILNLNFGEGNPYTTIISEDKERLEKLRNSIDLR